MRILYIGDVIAAHSGVTQKMIAQATEWERKGHEVWIATLRAPYPTRVQKIEQLLAEQKWASKPSLPMRIVGEIQVRALSLLWIKHVAKALGIELVYARELPDIPGVSALLAEINVILEVNGDSVKEASGRGRERRTRFRHWLLQRARGVIYVSRELRKVCGVPSTHSCVIANACPPVAEHILELRKFVVPRPRLVFVAGSERTWQGLDKVVWLTEQLPEFDFVIIGKRIPGERPNVTSFSKLNFQDTCAEIARSTVGICSLALHRVERFEASSLKSRLYLALGLPIIMGYEDTDLSGNEPYVLQIPNTETNCAESIDAVRSFVRRVHKMSALGEQALRVATHALSLSTKEEHRLAFFERCLSQ